MQGTQVASLFGVLDLKDNLTPGLDKAQRGMNTFGAKLSNAGSKVSALSSKITLLAAPLALLGGVSVKAAIEWESAFAGVRKTVEGTDEELATLERGLRDLATSADSPVSSLADAHMALAGVAEIAGQLGVDQKYILEFTETMAMMGMATNLTAEDAAVLAAQFANITGMDMTNIDKWGSSIVWLGNNSATTERQIAEMAQRIAAAGALAGLSEPEILGLAAAVSSLGFDPEAGGTAISRVMNDITMWEQGNNTDKLSKMGDVAGVTGDEFAKLWREEPMNAFILFLEGLGEQENAVGILEDLGWNSARLTPLMLSLSRNTGLLEDSVRGANDAWMKNNALTDEARKRAETTESAIQRTRNNLQGLAITIGSRALPAVATLTDKLSGLANSLVDTNPKIIDAALGLGLLLVVAGPTVKIIGGLLAVVGFLTAPLAILALLLAGGLVANMGDFAANLKQTGDAIREGDLVNALTGIVGALVDIPEGIAMAVLSLMGVEDPKGGLKAWEGVFENIKAIIKWIGEKAGNILGSINFEIPEPIVALWNMLKDIVGWIGEVTGLGGGGGGGGGMGIQPTLLPAGGGGTHERVRDSGGPVSAGTPYFIGRGAQPELFVPGSSGMMYPAGTYGGTAIQIGAVYVQDEDPARWLDRLEREASRRNLTLGVARGG